MQKKLFLLFLTVSFLLAAKKGDCQVDQEMLRSIHEDISPIMFKRRSFARRLFLRYMQYFCMSGIPNDEFESQVISGYESPGGTYHVKKFDFGDDDDEK
jgi:hypothetical protein